MRQIRARGSRKRSSPHRRSSSHFPRAPDRDSWPSAGNATRCGPLRWYPYAGRPATKAAVLLIIEAGPSCPLRNGGTTCVGKWRSEILRHRLQDRRSDRPERRYPEGFFQQGQRRDRSRSAGGYDGGPLRPARGSTDRNGCRAAGSRARERLSSRPYPG